MRRATALSVVVVFAGGCALAPDLAASGQEGESPVYERVELRFTSESAGTRTGFRWRVKQHPVASDAQPPPVRRARLRFPTGTRFDTSAVRRCTATDGELQERGGEACPVASRLGGGTGTVYLGSPEHLLVDVDVYNSEESAVLILSTEAGDVLRVLRGKIRGSLIDATLPRVELPGGKEAALTSLTVRLRRAGTRAKPWLRTPKRCPASRVWKFVYDIDYDDPPGRQTPVSFTRCRR